MYIRVRCGSKTVIYHGPRTTTRNWWRLFRKLAINMCNDMKRDVFPTGHARKERGVLSPAMTPDILFLCVNFTEPQLRLQVTKFESILILITCRIWAHRATRKRKIQSLTVLTIKKEQRQYDTIQLYAVKSDMKKIKHVSDFTDTCIIRQRDVYFENICKISFSNIPTNYIILD